MKILLVHNHYHPPSGENVVFKNELELLKNNGIEVITYERSNDEIDHFTALEKMKLARSAIWSKRVYKDISDIIYKNRPEVAHFHNTFPLISPSAYAACQDNGVAVVQTLHNYRLICPGAMLQRDGSPCEDCVGKNLIPALQNRCYRNSLFATTVLSWMLLENRRRGSYYRLVNKYIALTNFAASRMIKGGFPPDLIDIKPNFLPVVPSCPCGKENYAVYTGLISKPKGLMTLMKAWKKLKHLPLKIIGEGPLRAELEKQVAREDLNVEFLGYRTHDDVISIVQKACLQVIPSEWYEGFPMTVLEAYACGTPIIASRIGSLGEVVIDGETGLLFSPGNPDDLFLKVSAIIERPSLAKYLEQNALTLFNDNYTPNHNFSMLINIYKNVLKKYEHRS